METTTPGGPSVPDNPGAEQRLALADTRPSRMVAEAVSGTTLQTTVARLTTGKTPMFHGNVYNPRRDKRDKRGQWQEDIMESLRKSEIPSSTLSTTPPTTTTVMTMYPKLDSQEVKRKLNELMSEYFTPHGGPSEPDCDEDESYLSSAGDCRTSGGSEDFYLHRLGLTLAEPDAELGPNRGKRAAMVVVDGVIRYMEISEAPDDPTGDGCNANTSAEQMLRTAATIE